MASRGGRSRNATLATDASAPIVTTSTLPEPLHYLAQFQCPFALRRISFKKRCSIGEGCPFGHLPPPPPKRLLPARAACKRGLAAAGVVAASAAATGPSSTTLATSEEPPLPTLVRFPNFVCALHLLGRCDETVTLARCSAGLHLADPENLLKHLDKIEEEFTAQTAAPPPAGHDLECGICFESFASDPKQKALYVLQENCDHLLCAVCASQWYKESIAQLRCPFCRAQTSTLVMVSQLPDTESEKKRLFEFQKHFVAVSDLKLRNVQLPAIVQNFFASRQ